MAFNIIQSPILLQATALGLGSALCTGVLNRMLGSKTDKASKVYAKFALTTAAVDYFIVKGVELAGKVFTLPRATILLAILAGNCAYVAYAFGLLSKCFSGKSKPNEQNRTEPPKKVTPPKTIQSPKETPPAQNPINLANNANVTSNNTPIKNIKCCVTGILPREGMIIEGFMKKCIEIVNAQLNKCKNDKQFGLQQKNTRNIRFEIVEKDKAAVRFVFTKVDSRLQPIEIRKDLLILNESKKPTILILLVFQISATPNMTEQPQKDMIEETFLTDFFESNFNRCGESDQVGEKNETTVIPHFVKYYLRNDVFDELADKLAL